MFNIIPLKLVILIFVLKFVFVHVVYLGGQLDYFDLIVVYRLNLIIRYMFVFMAKILKSLTKASYLILYRLIIVLLDLLTISSYIKSIISSSIFKIILLQFFMILVWSTNKIRIKKIYHTNWNLWLALKLILKSVY